MGIILQIFCLALVLFSGGPVGPVETLSEGAVFEGAVFTADTGAVYSEKDIKLSKNLLEAAHRATGEPFTGELTYYYKAGKPAYTYPYVNGKLHGQARTFDEAGRLASESTYVNGLAHGLRLSYHPNGVVSEEAPSADGLLEGVVKYYDTTGRLMSEHPYESGQLHGETRYYNRSGRLWGTDLHEHGKKVR